MKKQPTLLKLSVIASALILSSQLSAAAFQLVETSNEGLGRAYAGNAAVANNASVISSNPALMTNFKRPELSIGFIYVKPDINLSGNTKVPTPKGIANIDVSHKDIAPSAIIPNLYFIYPLSEKTSIGAGIYVNYGLKTEFNKDYKASNIGGITDLETVNYNVSFANKITDKLSFGVGFNATYAKARVQRGIGLGAAKLQGIAGKFGIGDKMKGASAATNGADLRGHAWGYGYNLGLAYQINENHSIGVAYFSGIDIDFDGRFKSNLPSEFNSVPGLPRGTDGEEIDGSLTLKLPSTYEISSSHKFGEKTVLSLSYKFTRWKKFQELKATDSQGKQLFQKNENFGNSSRYAIGLSHDLTNKLTLRIGYAYDTTPVSGDNFTISIPDADRQWYSFGATYKFTPSLSLDAGFAYLAAKDNTFIENEKGQKYTFSSKSHASLYGLNLNYTF